MPRKTRRRISETRRSRRIRRRGTRRSGTRIRGGNRRYHNGGGFLENWSDVKDKFKTAKEVVRNTLISTRDNFIERGKKLLTNPSATSHTPTSQTP